MESLAQETYSKHLSVLPRLNEIGGIMGHRLDIYAERTWTFKVRLSLQSVGVLALEQVIIYGIVDGEDQLVELTKLPKLKVQQSSTALLPNEDDEDLVARHGATSAINGMINGYNRSETLEESNPFWLIEFPQMVCLETIHLNYCCIPGYINHSSTLIIEHQFNNKWELLYDRSSPQVIHKKYSDIITKLSPLLSFRAYSAKQNSILTACLEVTNKLSRPDAVAMTETEASTLLEFAEAFLPVTLSPAGQIYEFKNIPDVRCISISGIKCTNINPVIFVRYIGQSGEILCKSYRGSTIELEINAYILSLNISFEHVVVADQANCFQVNVTSELPEAVADKWVTVYDNAETVDLCGQTARLAYLSGDDSARCIGLVAKAKLMARRDQSSLSEAYYWCRLNLHGKSSEYRKTLLSIVDSATSYEPPISRLSFGRHSFTTKMGNRDQAQYIAALSSTIELLKSLKFSAIILYGTLLGAVREGSFIDHDDDVDLGYFSESTTIEELYSERDKIIDIFVSSGFDVAPLEGHPFLTFSVAPGRNEEKFWIEIFPIWPNIKDNECYNLYMNLMEISSVPKSLIGNPGNLSTAFINGVAFPAPINQIGFIELRYGPTWSTPDQLFEI